MPTMLKTLATLAGAVAFASAAQAGDIASGNGAPDTAAIEYGGGCGFSSAHLQAQIDAAEQAEKAKVRAGIESLLDTASAARETASAPASLPVPGQGS